MRAAEIGLGGLAADANLSACCQSVWIGIIFSQRRVEPLAAALEIQLNRAEPVFSPVGRVFCWWAFGPVAEL